MSYLEKQLAEAAKKGNKEQFSIIIDQGVSLETPIESSHKRRLRDKNGHSRISKWTSLAECVFRNDHECVEFLIERGADVNAKCEFVNESILSVATQQGHLDMVKYLVDHGADIEVKDKYDNTLLLIAARHGHSELLDYFIQKGLDCNASNSAGINALIWSAGKNYIELVKMLVENGININWQSNTGETALHRAIQFQNTLIIDYLLNHGADLSIKDKEGVDGWALIRMRNLFAAINEKDVDAVAKLINVDKNVFNYHERALRLAINDNQSEMMMLLIRHGVNVEVSSDNSFTTLIRMAQNNLTDEIKELIKLGADINAMSYDGRTTLMHAIISGNVEATLTLLELGSDIERKDKSGQTVMDIAIRYGTEEVGSAILSFKEHQALQQKMLINNNDTPRLHF